MTAEYQAALNVGASERLASAERPIASVIVAAHNEETVIGRCLDVLLQDARANEFEVIVVANGCDDATAEVAANRNGVRVLETPVASKPRALNAGDALAAAYPRIYLDADVLLSTDGARRLVNALAVRASPGDGRSSASGKPLQAASPRRDVDLIGRPLLVRAYYAISTRLPVFESGLFGRGVIVLSESGRSRFERFPDLQADDLFVDSIFDNDEIVRVHEVATVIQAPRRTTALINRLVRVRRSNAELRSFRGVASVHANVRASDRFSWFRDVVLPRPWLAPAGVAYVVITVAAAGLARGRSRGGRWERDESSRRG